MVSKRPKRLYQQIWWDCIWRYGKKQIVLVANIVSVFALILSLAIFGKIKYNELITTNDKKIEKEIEEKKAEIEQRNIEKEKRQKEIKQETKRFVINSNVNTYKQKKNTKWKSGDRIKIYDMNAPMIKLNDGYRYSIGGLDTVVKVDDKYIYCDSGEQYLIDSEVIDKVSSNREWRELVDMELKGELSFCK